ncbi:hypothetical protein GCM10009743_50730 [Kribbella swartbergensis]
MRFVRRCLNGRLLLALQYGEGDKRRYGGQQRQPTRGTERVHSTNGERRENARGTGDRVDAAQPRSSRGAVQYEWCDQNEQRPTQSNAQSACDRHAVRRCQRQQDRANGTHEGTQAEHGGERPGPQEHRSYDRYSQEPDCESGRQQREPACGLVQVARE